MTIIARYLELAAAAAEEFDLPLPARRAVDKMADEAIRNSGAYYRFHHDFETFNEASLPDVGTDVYSRHPTCEPLMLAYGLNDNPVRQWVPAEGEPQPPELREIMTDRRAIKIAWNKPFEWAIWANALGIETPHDQWRDPMVLAFSLSLPGSLEKAGEVVGLSEEKQKLKDGKALVRKFCIPRKPTRNKPYTRVLPEHEPEDWERFKFYNRNDVEAERGILKKLVKFDMSREEWRLWVLDQKINQAGIPINMEMVENAIKVYEDMFDLHISRMQAITGLDNPNSNKQLLAWLQSRGYPFEDVQKGHIERAHDRLKERKKEDDFESFEESEMAEETMQVLESRRIVASASPKKFYALRRAVDTSGPVPVLRNAFQFVGAGRTGRWAGRLFQAQNLPRPAKALEDDMPTHVNLLTHQSFDVINILYDKPMDLLKSCIRPAAQAPAGSVFVDADLNAIENRVLGWVAMCKKILSVFADGRCPYVDFATYLFGGTYAELWHEYKVEKNSFKRTIAKPGVLGCFEANTPVLTHRGWKRIVDVRKDDLVHDGVSFVRHDGVAYRGRKETVDLHGIHVTPDHEFLVGNRWVSACQLESNRNQFEAARNTADGLLSGSAVARAALAVNIGAFANAALTGKYRAQTFFSARHQSAIPALRRIDAAVLENASARSFTTFSQIVSMLRAHGAKTPGTRLTNIMGVGEFVCGSSRLTNGSISLSASGPTDRLNATERTMTETMSREICGSPHDQSKTRISETWDILNAGANSRFVVLTDDGPVVAHNCGYMLSAGHIEYNRQTGEVEATGLLGYAWNMGIRDFTEEQAKLSVETFRREFAEVKDFWYAIERAAIACVRTGQPQKCSFIWFEYNAPFLRMILPSGRALSYCRPKVEERETPWGKRKLGLTYEGLNDKNHWGTIHTHGGKLTENAVQAIARDLLAHGLTLAAQAGLDIRLHVHDQIVALALAGRADKALEILIDCMKVQPKWAAGLPLGAEGHFSPLFLKG